MTDKPTALPGSLFLTTTTATTEMNITNDIPTQVLFLRGYRFEFNSAATALAYGVVYIKFTPDILNGNKTIDNNVGQVSLPIMLDNLAVTHTYGMDIPIPMTNHLNQRFTMTILDQNFAPVTNLVRASLQFYMLENRL